MENTFHNQFQIYDGKETYIFVSYCHQNAKQVLDILESLVQSGCRIWFDGGIPWTDEWARTIIDRIRSCAVFMGFHSADSALSEHCRLEVFKALELHKPILSVYLEDVELGFGLDQKLAQHEYIRMSEFDHMETMTEAIMHKNIASQCAVA